MPDSSDMCHFSIIVFHFGYLFVGKKQTTKRYTIGRKAIFRDLHHDWRGFYHSRLIGEKQCSGLNCWLINLWVFSSSHDNSCCFYTI